MSPIQSFVDFLKRLVGAPDPESQVSNNLFDTERLQVPLVLPLTCGCCLLRRLRRAIGNTGLGRESELDAVKLRDWNKCFLRSFFS